MPYQWLALNGTFTFEGDTIRFKGHPEVYEGKEGAAVGTALSDQRFAGGTISADITFPEVTPLSACDIMFWYHPQTRYFVSAGLSREALFVVRHFDTKWTAHAAVGDGSNLMAGRTYHVRVQLRGSRVSLTVDGVDVAAATLPFSLTPSQVGVWCRGTTDVIVQNYEVQSETPRVFIVMEFKSPFNELHTEVLKVICKEFGLEAARADETYGPGLIIADIEKQIDEAKFIIAEITPPNANVYYEVGYARARNKPTILLADRRVEKLPFDVSPFRTLFYENTIDGKRKVEESLRRHIRAILSESGF